MTLFTLGPIPGKGQTFNYRNQQEALGPRCIRLREKLCGFFLPLFACSGRFELKIHGKVLCSWIFNTKTYSFLPHIVNSMPGVSAPG